MKKLKLNLYRLIAILYAGPLFLNTAVGLLTDFIHGALFHSLSFIERKLKS